MPGGYENFVLVVMKTALVLAANFGNGIKTKI